MLLMTLLKTKTEEERKCHDGYWCEGETRPCVSAAGYQHKHLEPGNPAAEWSMSDRWYKQNSGVYSQVLTSYTAAMLTLK